MVYWGKFFMVKERIYMGFNLIGTSTGIIGVWISIVDIGEMYTPLMGLGLFVWR